MPFINYSILTIGRLLEINVGVAQGAPRDHVSAYPYRQYGPRSRKLLKQHRLGDVGMQISNIKGRHRVVRSPWIHILRPLYT